MLLVYKHETRCVNISTFSSTISSALPLLNMALNQAETLHSKDFGYKKYFLWVRLTIMRRLDASTPRWSLAVVQPQL